MHSVTPEAAHSVPDTRAVPIKIIGDDDSIENQAGQFSSKKQDGIYSHSFVCALIGSATGACARIGSAATDET